MDKGGGSAPGVVLALPGRGDVCFRELVLDFTGTLSRDGELLPGVAERLRDLAARVRITVMTADTFGTARLALAGLPVEVRLIATGVEKLSYVGELGAGAVIAIGNGRNDVAMVEAAALGIAVLGPEGAAGKLLRAADIVVTDIRDALDLLANPLRVKATLRD
jgi:soluble P-type ATPase